MDDDKNIFGRFVGSFAWHTSPIDWCEPNYAVTSSIVEFYNTVSNVAFLLLPGLLIYLFDPFARAHSRRVQFVWLLNIVIGVCSAYFHATLSLAGQLLDEFGILWTLGASLAFWTPKTALRRLLGSVLGENQEDTFERLMLGSTVVLTVMGCFWPFVNAFFLMISTVPVAVLLIADVIRCRDPLARLVVCRCLVFWLVAVVLWLSDRFACGLWLRIALPGAHWLWHLVSALSAYQGIVYVVYADAVGRAAKGGARPVIMRLWPSDRWRVLGVAYVALETKKSPRVEVNGNTGKEMCKNC